MPSMHKWQAKSYIAFLIFCHVCGILCIDADIDTEDIDTRDIDGDWYWHHEGTHQGAGRVTSILEK